MRKFQFILKLRELGFTDYFIGEVLDLRRREREQGIKRPWRDYIPGYEDEKNRRV